MGKVIAVGVCGSDISELLHHSMGISERNKNYPLGSVAVLLTCAELAILLAHEHWCFVDDESGMIELMRSKAKVSARDMFVRFRKFEDSQELKSDILGGSGND